MRTYSDPEFQNRLSRDAKRSPINPRDRTGVVVSHQTPVLVYAGQAIWHLWLTHNHDFTGGTYLVLMPDGRIFSDTIDGAQGGVNRSTIKHTVDSPEIFKWLHSAKLPPNKRKV